MEIEILRIGTKVKDREPQNLFLERADKDYFSGMMQGRSEDGNSDVMLNIRLSKEEIIELYNSL